MNPRYAHVAVRAGHRCEYCRAPEAVFNFPFEVEHVKPRQLGGADDSPNLALACRSCNLLKSDAVTAYDPVSGHEVPLFDPRSQTWSEHFTIDGRTLAIVGVTAFGRATVMKLRINSDLAIAARTQWRRLGLFPE